MEVEGTEQNIILQPEGMIVGAVTSVNGQTGDVVLTTSDLENTSDYQTGEDVQEAIAGKQDKLTAGNNIQISEQNVISATDTVYSAGNGINISPQNALSVDTTVVATQQNLSDEVTNRENADNYLQGQIDAISASSDVVDIVGTYADLQNYDTQHLKDNDIIKVLQDETQGDATTYYRWSTSTQTFTLIGQEGPYYTKAGADAQFVPQTRTVNGKALSSNITLNASDVSALGPDSVVQTTGNSTSQIMSQKATTDALDTKLNITDYVVDTQLADSDNPVQNRVLNGLLGNMPSDFFSGSATTIPTASTEVQFGNILGLDDAQLLGDTFQQTYSGVNLIDLTNNSYNVSGIELTLEDNYVTITSNENTGSNTYVGLSLNTPLVLPAGTYTLSKTNGVRYPYVQLRNGTNTLIKTDYSNQSVTQTFSESVTIDNVYCYFGSSKSAEPFYIQIESGSSPTSFEPYTGGIPAPNPDYPQQIQVVTGEQTVEVSDGVSSQSYAINLGKNLLNIQTATTSSPNMAIAINEPTVSYNITTIAGTGVGLIIDVNIEAGKTYTLKASRSAGVILDNIRISNGDWNTSGSYQSLNRIDTFGDGATFTADNNYSKLRIWINNSNSGGVDTGSISYIQLELGSSASSYASYFTPIELCPLGDYQDYIYKSGDDWYVHKETARVDVSSLSGWFASGSYAYKTRDGMSDILPASSDSATAVGSCNAFSASTTNLVYAGSVDYGFALPGAGGTGVLIRNKNVASLADFTTYLSNNSVYGYFALATPTDTKITDATLISELEALLNASTYDGETDLVITATGTNLPAPLQLTAVNANAKGLIYKLRA